MKNVGAWSENVYYGAQFLLITLSESAFHVPKASQCKSAFPNLSFLH